MTIRAKKSLGQHFLCDQNLSNRIARFADVQPGDIVVEIGPGTGNLSRALLALCNRLTAVEKDRQLAQDLQQRAHSDPRLRGLEIVEGDALEIDWPQLLDRARGNASPGAGQHQAASVETECPPTKHSCGDDRRLVKIVGNLPYNVATRILSQMTSCKDRFHSLTVMIQKEVSQRIEARRGGKEYGYLSLLMQHHFHILPGFDVPPQAFRPRPKVMSRVLQLLPAPNGDTALREAAFEKLLKRAFSHRRKTLANNLKRFYPEAEVEKSLQACGLGLKVRPQEAGLEHFRCLAGML